MWINTAINNRKIASYCPFFITLLFSINAGAMNYSSAWVRLALVYYKNFPYHEINRHETNSHEVNVNTHVSGCMRRTNPTGSHHTLWHCWEKIYLLRPLSEVASWHKEQGHLKLKFSAFKINHIRAKITSFHILKNAPDLSAGDHMPVTGIFITHAPVVEQYRFRHISTGRISTIRATPDHPFYLQNSGSFVPVAQLSSAGNLLNSRNEIVRIICPADHTANCGTSRYTSLPAQVYNLEIYKKHAFYAGNEKILVHNCNSPASSTYPASFTDVVTYNHIIMNREKQLNLKIIKLSTASVNAILNKMAGDVGDIGKTVYYNLPQEWTLCFSHRAREMAQMFEKTGTLEHITDEGELLAIIKDIEDIQDWEGKNIKDIGDIMRTAQGFDDAKTVFIVNSGMNNEYNTDGEYKIFTNSFKALANYIGKDVIFNLRGHIDSTPTWRPGHYIFVDLGFHDEEEGCFHSHDFREALSILVRPDR